MSTQSKRIVRAYLLLFVLLAALSFLSLAVGSVRVSAADILAALGGKEGTDMTRHILFDIRLPRMLAALILGGALSVSGFLLQTFFSNPIAGPFVLGISSGAKLAVSIFMILFLGQGLIMNSWVMIGAAFLGAMASMGFVLAVSKKLPQMSMLVVSGIMIGYICSAATDFIVPTRQSVPLRLSAVTCGYLRVVILITPSLPAPYSLAASLPRNTSIRLIFRGASRSTSALDAFSPLMKIT